MRGGHGGGGDRMTPNQDHIIGPRPLPGPWPPENIRPERRKACEAIVKGLDKLVPAETTEKFRRKGGETDLLNTLRRAAMAIEAAVCEACGNKVKDREYKAAVRSFVGYLKKNRGVVGELIDGEKSVRDVKWR